MKKFFVIIPIILICFLFLFMSYKDNKQREKIVFDLVNNMKSMSIISHQITEKNILYIDLNNKIDDISVSLKREEYDLVLKDINNFNDDLLKEKLLARMSVVLDNISKEEERILKYTAIETLKGNVTAYTAFCSDGCHGYTASGRYVGDSIYYHDNDYGNVRIVAGDKSYPFGTIVRFNNLSYFGSEVYAIVLDRGGAIGKNRRALFDLLFENEKSANNFGIARGVSCDILRLGY